MNDFTDIVSKVMEVRPDEGDYTGEDAQSMIFCASALTPSVTLNVSSAPQ